ncbi:Hypothetical predicted protein [Mytilus galloprovincialis]|uniref:EGF-like domain-containing protein n=1 Tax=Mytilus galloprovincialis TaxID=29158 RepID=A0A8B6DQZ9_MYTGA|nr:Hypothetical predicted protein [Mytilus galloprovincialis]
MLLIRILLICFILIEYCTGQNAPHDEVKMAVNHRLKCTENETQTIACRNGGTCFATFIEDRFVRCACVKKYTGKFCEMIDINIIFKREREEKTTNAGLIAGIITIVLLFTVVIIILICKKKHKRETELLDKDQEEQKDLKTGLTDGNEIKQS